MQTNIIFHTYYRRNPWPEHIKAALIDFSDRFHAAPVLLRVNCTEYDAVIEATQALGIPVPIKVNGGTLRGELELGIEEAA